MKKMLCLTAALGLVLSVGSAGCDRPPSVPRRADWKEVRILAVSQNDATEQSAVRAVEAARVNYRYRLAVLAGYYEKVGNLDKYNWTQRELKNLAEAQKFQWQGIGEVSPPEGESIASADEKYLVELVVQARRTWKQAVEELVELYRRRGNELKRRCVENILERFDPVRTYMYFLSAEIPPADLTPEEVIPEADRLYEKAMKLYEDGRILPLVIDYDKERKALMTFRQLINEYPRSTKIALSAYYIGEIYKEYFDENIRAVHWYRRAWQWDPAIPKPARFQAATVYDIRLHNYAKAIECYRAAIEHEQFNSSNVSYAHRRIRELKEK